MTSSMQNTQTITTTYPSYYMNASITNPPSSSMHTSIPQTFAKTIVPPRSCASQMNMGQFNYGYNSYGYQIPQYNYIGLSQGMFNPPLHQ